MLQVVSELKVAAFLPLGIFKKKGNRGMLLVRINSGISLIIYILIYALHYF